MKSAFTHWANLEAAHDVQIQTGQMLRYEAGVQNSTARLEINVLENTANSVNLVIDFPFACK